jgi:hypothetical protein
LRPLGPRVTCTASASLFTPRRIEARASMPKRMSLPAEKARLGARMETTRAALMDALFAALYIEVDLPAGQEDKIQGRRRKLWAVMEHNDKSKNYGTQAMIRRSGIVGTTLDRDERTRAQCFCICPLLVATYYDCAMRKGKVVESQKGAHRVVIHFRLLQHCIALDEHIEF